MNPIYNPHNAFELATVAIFLFLAVIWTNKSALNVFFKMLFFGMTIWGLVALFGK
jgi:hypothetical protein